MYNLVKYKKINTLDDINTKGRLMIQNSIKSFHQGYNVRLIIDIVTKCEPFSNPRYPDYIRVCCRSFDVGLHIPMSELTVRVLKLSRVGSSSTEMHLYVCLWVLTKLDKH